MIVIGCHGRLGRRTTVRIVPTLMEAMKSPMRSGDNIE
jgi:hypothetical protein